MERVKWEYYKANKLFWEDLEELGEEGWELVAYSFDKNGQAVFKRPKEPIVILKNQEEKILDWIWESALSTRIKHILYRYFTYTREINRYDFLRCHGAGSKSWDELEKYLNERKQ